MIGVNIGVHTGISHGMRKMMEPTGLVLEATGRNRVTKGIQGIQGV